MKREIKFRGKDESGKWLYGNFVRYIEDDGEHMTCIVGSRRNDVDACVEFIQVDPDTIGQFTGLYDKNGVKIYEGDVVKTQFNKNPLGWVIWHEDGYFCICTSKEKFGNGYSFMSLGELMHQNINGEKVEVEVIGNIYDNKDLL